MNMLPTVSARLFFSFGNRNSHLLLAKVGKATLRTTSGVTIAETAGTSVTYVHHIISHGDAASIAHEKNLVFADPTGLPRASSPTRRARRAVCLWTVEHALWTFLRRRCGACTRPRTARLGKRGNVRRRLGCKRADKRRQACA